ncbi:MAG: DinB family protein [Dehalococcoidia bacterium]|nr:DinB family protein [Dehalococcoidia bacterium]
MAIADYIRPHLTRLHDNLIRSAQSLTQEQLHWPPADGSNHIAFCLWHYTRSEDNLVRWTFQNPRPTVWLEEGWHEKFGLDRARQGTGMTPQEAVAVRFPDINEFLTYMNHAWQSTDEFLASATTADLERAITGNYRPGTKIADVLAITLAHGWGHLGQIWAIRGMMEMGEGSPI